MGRAEKRRLQKQQNKTATYNLTKEQLDTMVHERIKGELDKIKEEATVAATNEILLVLFTLPMDVLMENFWLKSCHKNIPKFTELLLEKYDQWQNGELDEDELKEKLWKYGGIKLMLNEENE